MKEWIPLFQSLVWPMALALIILLFRKDIRQFIARIEFLAWKDTKAVFKKDLENTRDEVTELSENFVKSTKQTGSTNQEIPDTLLKIVQLSPSAAISEIWRDVEAELRKITDYVEPDEKHIVPMPRDVHMLVRKGVISEQSYNIYSQLRNLRNQATHIPDMAISKSEAIEYIKSAIGLITYLQFLSLQNEKNSTVNEKSRT